MPPGTWITGLRHESGVCICVCVVCVCVCMHACMSACVSSMYTWSLLLFVSWVHKCISHCTWYYQTLLLFVCMSGWVQMWACNKNVICNITSNTNMQCNMQYKCKWQWKRKKLPTFEINSLYKNYLKLQKYSLYKCSCPICIHFVIYLYTNVF